MSIASFDSASLNPRLSQIVAVFHVMLETDSPLKAKAQKVGRLSVKDSVFVKGKFIARVNVKQKTPGQRKFPPCLRINWKRRRAGPVWNRRAIIKHHVPAKAARQIKFSQLAAYRIIKNKERRRNRKAAPAVGISKNHSLAKIRAGGKVGNDLLFKTHAQSDSAVPKAARRHSPVNWKHLLGKAFLFAWIVKLLAQPRNEVSL